MFHVVTISAVNACATTLLCAFALVGLATVGSTTWAVDKSRATPPTVTELKPRMKALASEALNAGDLWTAIQADAYASYKLGVRSSGVIGKSVIIGNPLFAFPHTINAYWDRGDRLIVVSGTRIYQLSPDGYPLGVSIPLKITPTYSALSEDGRYLALFQRITSPTYQFEIRVMDMIDGNEAWAATLPLTRGDSIYGPIKISQEGQALAFGMFDSTEALPFLQVVRAKGKNVKVPGHYRAVAIGAEGKWGMAEPFSNRRDDVYRVSLLTVGNIKQVIRGVSSQGIAAIITEGPDYRLQIVGTEGAIVEPQQTIRFSDTARLYSTGEWLLAASGTIRAPVVPEVAALGNDIAALTPAPTVPVKPVAEPELDLLGNPILPEPAPRLPIYSSQPYTVACYRWADLLKPETAKPAHTIVGVCSVSQLTPGLVFVQKAGKLHSINLNDLLFTPVDIPIAAPVYDLDLSYGRLIVEYKDNKKQILNEAGVELWEGVTRRINMLDASHAILHRDGGLVDLVHLSEDKGLRKVVNIDVPDKSFDVYEYDRFDRRLVVSSGARSWIEYDPMTGKRIGTHEGEARKPQVPTWGFPYGRFSVQGARLIERNQPYPEDPSNYWNPRDAWRVSNSLVVLDHYGQIHVSGRKRGSYMTIGSVDSGWRFGVLGNEMAIGNYDGMAIATLAAGPTIVPIKAGNSQRMEEMNEGPWRVKNLFYIPPRSPSLMFDPTTCGFSPSLLRSPPGASTLTMLMITDSLVFDVEPNLGKALGILDRDGLRDQDD